MVIKAGFKYFPSELGLLLLTENEHLFSPLYFLSTADIAQFGPQRQELWKILEECLEEMEDLNLHEPDPTTNLYPFIVAASDQSCSGVDLVYYLVRKDPSVLLHYNSCKERLEGNTSRKRKKM